MSQTTPSYEELISQINKLKADNKSLRLRPSIHSTDANVLNFLDLKNQLSLEALSAKTCKEVIKVCAKYLQKINNIHSVSFFEYKKKKISIIREYNLPKKFVQLINNSNDLNHLQSLLFSDRKISTNHQVSNSITDKHSKHPFHSFLNSFKSTWTIPLFEEEGRSVSLLLLSRKQYENDTFFRVLIQSLQIQIQSIFQRLLILDEIQQQSNKLTKAVEEKTQSIENMNSELLEQIKLHKEKNQYLIEEINLFKSLIHQQKDIVLRINTDGQILFHNPAFKKNIAAAKSDSNLIFSYLGEGDFPGLNTIIQDFDNGIQWVHCEIQLQTDSLDWYNFSFTPTRNKRGIITDIQVVARNIHQVKILEQKLRSQRKILINMIKSNHKVIFIMDTNGIIELVSDNCTNYTANNQPITPNEFFKKISHPDDYVMIIQNIDLLLAHKNTKWDTEFRLKGLNGNWHKQDLEINAINNSNDEIIYFFGSFSRRNIEIKKITP